MISTFSKQNSFCHDRFCREQNTPKDYHAYCLAMLAKSRDLLTTMEK